ncbi:MAG: nucleotide sugar dehydrogenase [Elusimicrobiota bacterium]
MYFKTLKEKLRSRKAKIGVIGLGYVGLPLAIEFAEAGFTTIGFEVDAKKVKKISKGTSYIADVRSAALKKHVRDKRLKATSDFGMLRDVQVIIICVPTPLRKSKDPDVSYIVSAAEHVKKHLQKGHLLILESTTYPGTTRDLVLPMLEKSGHKCGGDFFLAFSPERVDPSNKTFGIRNTPKIVGGITPQCTELARLLYSNVTDNAVTVSSPEAAEMVKLLENTFRAVNIALVNEVALMCDKLKLDVWEIIDAAATKPFGFMPFYPGPGIGGHCIPLDPQYLSWKLKTLNFYSRFIELAGEINSKMPEYVVRKISDSLNAKGISMKNAKILLVGLAYKKDVNDMRESPALDVMKLLLDSGSRVSYYDPYIPELKFGGKIYKSAKNLGATGKFDAVAITTNHTNINYAQLVSTARLVVDCRNATKNIRNPKIVKL